MDTVGDREECMGGCRVLMMSCGLWDRSSRCVSVCVTRLLLPIRSCIAACKLLLHPLSAQVQSARLT